MNWSNLPLMEMSEDQLVDFLCKLKGDEGLQDKLKGAADLDAAVAIVKEAGFNVSKADLLRHQAMQTIELSDEELEFTGGRYDGYERNQRNARSSIQIIMSGERCSM